MEVSGARQTGSLPSYLSPTCGADGVWASAGAHALRAGLTQRSARDVMVLLQSMEAKGMAYVLQEAGFHVSGSTVSKGHRAVLAEVQPALDAALRNGLDGRALARATPVLRGDVDIAPGPVGHRSEESHATGARSAADLVRAVFRGPSVRVVTLGAEPLHARTSLQMVAAQALRKRVQGFGFDGIPGKFDVSASMAEVVELHRCAASAVAVESTKSSLVEWASGEKVSELSEWVPDSVQRLLHGSLSRDAAALVVSGIASGTIARHAREFGNSGIAELLAAQGLDVTAPTVQEQATELGITVTRPDTQRGQYFGDVVAQDHRASLVKVNRVNAIELAHTEAGVSRPRIGELLRLSFKGGALTVSKAERPGRSHVAR